jgi:hypothetical protein
VNLTGARWRKSSYSGGNDGNACVEVAFLSGARVAIRDSKDHSLPAQVFPAAGWVTFTAAVRTGEFDPR